MNKIGSEIKTILINDRYLIWTDNWVIYDTLKGEDMPQYVFELMEKIKGIGRTTNYGRPNCEGI